MSDWSVSSVLPPLGASPAPLTRSGILAAIISPVLLYRVASEAAWAFTDPAACAGAGVSAFSRRAAMEGAPFAWVRRLRSAARRAYVLVVGVMGSCSSGVVPAGFPPSGVVRFPGALRASWECQRPRRGCWGSWWCGMLDRDALAEPPGGLTRAYGFTGARCRWSRRRSLAGSVQRASLMPEKGSTTRPPGRRRRRSISGLEDARSPSRSRDAPRDDSSSGHRPRSASGAGTPSSVDECRSPVPDRPLRRLHVAVPYGPANCVGLSASRGECQPRSRDTSA